MAKEEDREPCLRDFATTIIQSIVSYSKQVKP